jgi:hypothetical protein
VPTLAKSYTLGRRSRWCMFAEKKSKGGSEIKQAWESNAGLSPFRIEIRGQHFQRDGSRVAAVHSASIGLVLRHVACRLQLVPVPVAGVQFLPATGQASVPMQRWVVTHRSWSSRHCLTITIAE